ncbi:MAG TPA: amino acid adenylation domain-containing protein, partial [Mycobacteriales bacterium]|nr:amino acid adenylation domain-containing protein [Mycobacteriales bacterium]
MTTGELERDPAAPAGSRHHPDAGGPVARGPAVGDAAVGDAAAVRAELLRQRLAGHRGGRRSAIGRADRSGPLALSSGQQQMWFLNRLAPDSPEYLVPLALRLHGPLDRAALRAAWERMLHRHEILRTRYELGAGGEPVQLIDEPAPAELPVLDLTDLAAGPAGATGTAEAAEQVEARLVEQVEAAATMPFDLAREWPVRARLLRLADDDHVLVVVFHHIACDAWSARVFVAELSALYRGLTGADQPPLPPLPVQYADYAAWQRQQLAGPALDRQLDYWRRQLADLAPTELPTDRPRPAIRDGQGATVPFRFPPGLAERVRAVASQHDVTVFVVLLTAFQALLARYTGSTDIAVGTVVSGRARPELRNLIGYGINSLVMRSTWDGDPSGADLLAATHRTVLDAFDHQQVPFARLVDELQPDRDMSRTPLFQVAFTMHETRTADFELPGVRVEPLDPPWRTAKFDLTLQVEDGADGALNAQLEYATALFDPATVQRISTHFLRLLDGLTAAPRTRLSRLAILDAAELAAATAPAAPAEPVAGTIHGLFQRWVAEAPTAAAVTGADQELSYLDLNARANRVAHYLRGLGVGPEDLVGVCLDRGTDLVAVLLGVLKSGAAYLPLDPAQPADRLAFMLADSAAAAVLTSSSNVDRLAGYAGPVLAVDADTAVLAGCPATDPAPAGDPANLAYVIYTSGSTGRPKGVGVTHANVLRLFAATDAEFGFGPADVWTLFHSYAFDFSVWELFGALLYGGRLVVVPSTVARAPEEFLDLLVQQRVTVLNQTPSAFRGLVAAAAAGDPRLDRLALRAVVFGGEQLAVAELAPWAARLGLDRPAMVNMYGITETTVHVTYHQVTAADVAAGGSPVGGPIRDLAVYLLDRYGNPVPPGVAGEVYVGGPGVARGYLGRAELTAQRFVPDPFGVPGSRLYRSGDLARRGPGGGLEFLGRADDQVKIRGYRIELGEVTAALAGLPGVRAAVVLADEPRPGQRRLLGYYVPASGVDGSDPAGLDPAGLRAALARALPDYMVPAHLVPLAELPLNQNGKLDRPALPVPEQAAPPAGDGVPPRTPTEERVAAIWQQVLGVERLSVTASFFDLGGDSIRAVSLVGELRAAGFDVSVRDVFAHRTVAALCELLTGRPAPARVEPGVAPFALLSDVDRDRLPAGVLDAYPLSQVQVGMLVEMLAGDGRNSYHNVTTFRIPDPEPFSLPALRAATRLVTERHEVLRTSVSLDGYSVPLQLVHADAEIPLSISDLTGLDRAGQERELRALIRAERAALFDLAAPPLLRIGVHLADGAWWLSITECHVILEGWSYHSLLMELLDCYRRVRAGEQVTPAPAAGVRFADFIAGELESLGSAEDRGYWRGVVDGYGRFALPAGWGGDRSEPAQPYLLRVPYGDLESRLRALATKAHASLKSVLLAAHLKVLSQLTDEPSFYSGLVCDARPEALGADTVYGMYLNTVPFPLAGTAGTWRELVTEVFAREVQLWPHRRYPLPAIQREFGDGRRLIDVYFNYQDFHQVDTELVDYRASIDESPNEFALHVGTLGGHLGFSTNTHALSRANTERLAAMHRAVLEAMASDLDGDATRTFLPAGEAELLHGWANPAGPAVRRCLPEAFEARVLAAPDTVALVAGAVTLTYAELNARANRIAHHLRGLGVRPDDLVGVCLDRDADLVPVLLGVLKSGAAYLPLDPAQPAERLAFMLADGAAPVLITSSAQAARVAGDFTGALVVLDRDADRAALAGQPADDPVPAGGPENLAYVIYTSGSTGRPKGVGVTHANVLRLLATGQRHYDFGPADVWPLFHSYAFDVSVWELFGSLLHGGRLIVVPAPVTRSPEDFLDLLVEHQVTVLNQTPSAFRGLVAAAAAGDPRLDRLALRAVVFAGERLDVGDLAPWVARFGLDRPALLNMYGITETTVHTTFHRLTGADLAPGAPNPVGHPLGDLSVHLLDRRGHLVPIGVQGEIHVGGPGVARGYLGRAELTAQRFVPDPFGVPGSRLYRSGDLARRGPGGGLEFLGRADDQVKIRGYRIELGEISAALSAQPSIRDAAVVVRPDGAGQPELVAYLVPADGVAPAPAELRAALARTLPEYMVPAVFVPIGALPLTVNGKLDRRALPAPDRAAQRAEREFVAPRTPVEERVAAIWRQALGLDTVGVTDGFFDLGGDSIRAVSLVGALRTAGFDLSVRDVFERGTVAGLAELLTGRVAPVAAPTVAPFALLSDVDRGRLPADAVDAYPLSQVQLGMLIEMLADTGRNNYHNVTSFLVRDDHPVVLPALRRAAALLADRHETLRTSMHLDGFTVPVQIVHAHAEIPLGSADLRGLDGPGQDRALREFVAAERARPFELGTAPMLRLFVHLYSDGAFRLTFTQSHAITEGWSYHSLLMELLDCYRSIRDGAEPVLPALPAVRYADFIAAELDALESTSDVRYWQQLVDRNARFTLPAWGERPDRPCRPSRARVPLHDLEPGLRALATRAKASLKSVLLAAHLKVLSQLTPEPSFYSGLVCDARPEMAGAERVPGMYLNTLPFAIDRSARTWRELVAQVFAGEVALWPHRRFPLPAVQRLAGGRHLLDVIFTYLDFHHVDTDAVGVDETVSDAPTEFGLSVTTMGGYLGLSTSTHVLSQADVERLAGMYRAVLTAMASDVDGDAGLTFLPAGEQERVTSAWATRPGVAAADVPARIAAQIAATPDAVAVQSGGVTLTYAGLDARANQVAHRLRALGAGPESLVAVLLDRGPELLPSLLGAWRAGAAYLPLDPSWPAERLARVLADAGVTVALTAAPYAELLPAGVRAVDPAALSDEPTAPLAVAPDPDRLAYVIYTSGSTGTPKGVGVSHGGLATYLDWAVDRFLGAPGGAVVFSSVAFDMAVTALFGPLLVGDRVCLIPASVDLADLGAALSAAGPFGFVKVTPSHLEVLAAQLDEAQLAALAPIYVIGGEAFAPATANRWLGILGPGRLVNEYGPTEATVATTAYTVDGVQAGEVVPVGVPLPGSAQYVLDARLEPVPVGAVGELYLGGAQLARGYLDAPALTAARFGPDPYGPPGGRLYRTGDLARWRPDGTVEFLGRADDQVKIRGHRIEPGEAAAVLASHPGIREAAVLADGPAGDLRLVAYCVPAGGELPADLAEHCARVLPDYLVPTVYLGIDQLPLTANGKLDRRALPAPDTAAMPAGPAPVAPRSPLEQRVAAIWRQVLGVEQVSVTASFFELGGDSIRAVSLVGALRAAGYDLGVRDVFERGTVAGLAELLAGRTAPAEVAAPVPPFALLSTVDRERLPAGVLDAYPLSQVQVGMLVEMLADPGGRPHSYHNVNSFPIRDDRPFSPAALRQAAALLAHRHEVLRTSMRLDGFSVPLQLVHATAEIPVEVLDLRGLPVGRQESAVAELMDREQAALFDLARPPLLRLAAVVQTDQVWRLAFTVCHAVTDGWSHNSLLMELLACYRSIRDGAEPALPALPAARYADYIGAELAALESTVDSSYWQDVVDRHARFALPDGWGGDQPGSYRAGVPLHDLEPGLRALATRAKASLKSVLLAAHLKVLGQLTPEPSFLTGVVSDSRPEVAGAERMYGMYLNTLPFPAERAAGTWTQLVERVFAREVELWQHRRFPLPAIQRLAGTGRLLDVLFTFQDFHQLDTDAVDVEASQSSSANEFALSITTVPGHLVLRVDLARIGRPAADRLVAMYRAVLAAMASDVDGDATGTFLPAAELTDVTSAWAMGATAAATLGTLAQFEAQAVATPGATAVTSGGVRLSYAELDARANQIAHQLIGAGVGAEDLVGVLLDRTADLLPSLLGSWKAGAGYVPLDPSWPTDRIAAVLADAGAAALITSAAAAGRLSGGYTGPVLAVDLDREPQPTTSPGIQPDAGQVAYVIYTSGSTGTPKGVAVSQQALSAYLGWATGRFLGAPGGSVVFSSVAFDMAVTALFAPLLVGERVCLVPGAVDLADLGAALAAAGPFGFLKLTPSHLEVLAAQLDESQLDRLAAVYVIGGEAFHPAVANRWLATLGPGRLVNEYGPTEATVATTAYTVDGVQAGEVVPVGVPAPGSAQYVLDGRLGPVPVGVVGELYLGGAQLARGYLNAPALTAARFVPDPYGPAGARLYRTGDLARWRPDGAVEFLGRADDQVKIRGHRVEPGEIAAALAGLPAVREAAVIGVPDE